MEHQGSKTDKEIGKETTLFDIVQAVEEDQDGNGITHQVDHHDQTTHHEENDDSKGEVGTIALQETHEQDHLNERNNKLEEQVTIASCNHSADVGEDGYARFESK